MLYLAIHSVANGTFLPVLVSGVFRLVIVIGSRCFVVHPDVSTFAGVSGVTLFRTRGGCYNAGIFMGMLVCGLWYINLFFVVAHLTRQDHNALFPVRGFFYSLTVAEEVCTLIKSHVAPVTAYYPVSVFVIFYIRVIFNTVVSCCAVVTFPFGAAYANFVITSVLCRFAGATFRTHTTVGAYTRTVSASTATGANFSAVGAIYAALFAHRINTV